MERLTEKNDTGVNRLIDCEIRWRYVDGIMLQKAIDRLAQYEDAEAEGRLVELLCNVGKIVYVLYADPDDENAIIRFEVAEIKISLSAETEYWAVGDSDGWAGEECLFTESNIGKTIFLTREEAEKALKGDE